MPLRQRDTKLLLGPQALSHRVGPWICGFAAASADPFLGGKGKNPRTGLDWTELLP